MSKMFRRTITILSLTGLLLSVGLWVASYFAVSYGAPNMHPKFQLLGGRVSWCGKPQVRLLLSYPHGADIPPRPTGTKPRWVVLGFHGFKYVVTNTKFSYSQATQYLAIPLWMPSVLFGSMLLLCRTLGAAQRRRARDGLCLKCGYDLRGSKERCPECGTPFNP